ncbi:MAG: hypothetical protein AAGA95_16535 [Pseudomonadota bacterium]
MSEEKKAGMSAVGVITICVVVAYLGLELYGLHHARERMAPQAVYAEFVGARRAIEMCNPNPPQAEDFERNFRAVTARATRELEAQEPSPTVSEITEVLAQRRASRESEVEALVADLGCKGSEVWRLQKLYEARSRLNLR